MWLTSHISPVLQPTMQGAAVSSEVCMPATGIHLHPHLNLHECCCTCSAVSAVVTPVFCAADCMFRVPKAEFNRTAAGLLGSSYLSMPWWWHWATIGVEYHHFHHQNARLPCYRMRVSAHYAYALRWVLAAATLLQHLSAPHSPILASGM